MKRKIGTLVLFVLLLLTVVALKQVDTPDTTTVGRAGAMQHATN